MTLSQYTRDSSIRPGERQASTPYELPGLFFSLLSNPSTTDRRAKYTPGVVFLLCGSLFFEIELAYFRFISKNWKGILPFGGLN